MLENENVKDELEALFRREKMKEVSPSWWENLKVKVKEILIANSKRIARLSSKELEEITTPQDTTGEKATPSKEDYLDGAIIYGFAGVFTTR
ncbi:hypothetical protein LSH36_120g10006 [Paralvinella palmiformis]|uniref:Uncharacterized protein n=1 Tax=Paralvinella palmiformis TaxID=53620 RepID=A0AAD9JA75_9ANNE|nr:hypothetical protein LSH36_492g06043 [Paralvinella palmiformis]KAK2161183.1 hypothetical protein LSH36_120g10006 [Paralvinella palmiformis]